MHRTQIYLEPGQHRALKKLARTRSISMTECIRRILAEHLSGRSGPGPVSKEDVMSIVALGRSGRDDTSERHDEALDEAFRGGALR